MGRWQVLALDCDGVMFDTRKANSAYYNDILAAFGRPPMTSDQYAYAQMQTVDRAIAYLFEDEASQAAAHAFRKKNGYDPYIPLMEMEPDLIRLLDRYRGRLHLAVATNRSDTMGKVLKVHGLENYFDLVVTALDVAHPKPHPEPLTRILEHFRALPEQMLYVGDSPLDELTARAAGVPLAAYGNPDLDGDYHITRLSQLEEILNSS